jgi:AbrB family looped-hinge helix DNA binding protein
MTRFSGRIDVRGRITMPPKIRRRLGLAGGDKVEFVCDKSRTIVRPLRPRAIHLRSTAASLGTFAGGKRGINVRLRELR